MLGLLASACPSAFALNPSLDLTQYAHTSWNIRDGFPKGLVQAIAQTSDGYLWLGTEFGLVRFDGVHPVDWQPPAGQQLPSNNVRELLVTRDGALWIGTTNGLASWKDGALTHYPELAGAIVGGLLEDRAGSVWTAGQRPGRDGKFCEIRGGAVQCFEQSDGRNLQVIWLYRSRSEEIWAGANGGLARWSHGSLEFYSFPGEGNGVRVLGEEENGALLIAGRSGIMRFAGGKSSPYLLPGVTGKVAALRLLRDRDGAQWVATSDRGLLHVHDGTTDVLAQAGGLSSDDVSSLFEDREGVIWVATANGLDRFRDFAVPTFSAPQGLGASPAFVVAADPTGAIWIGASEGLKRWRRGEVTAWRERGSQRIENRPPIPHPVREVIGAGFPFGKVQSLFPGAGARTWFAMPSGIGYSEGGEFVKISSHPGRFINALSEDNAGNLWMANQYLGLLRLSPAHQVRQFPWSSVSSEPATAISLVADPSRGGIWLGFFQGGVAWFHDGRIQASFGARDGLGQGRVTHLRFDSIGALWAATQGGISRLKNGHIATLSAKNGLPCDAVNWSMEDDFHSYWLYMPCGLVRIDRAQMDAWIAAADANRAANRSLRVAVFDASDGVRTAENLPAFSPHVTRSPDGRLWFPAIDGVSVIDPAHLAFNKLPPPVHIEQITADRKLYPAIAGERLPPLVRDIEIDYTALSLVAPEKNRFRYKLEGYDPDWHDAGGRRQAFYTHLDPRPYRFRVLASNNSGVWNETGDTLEFVIDPAYYQTAWFKAACLGVLLIFLWGLHRYRLYHVSREFNMRLEERIGERMRIARDLHDTLLQSFQGSLFEFQAARNLFSRRPDDALHTLDDAIASAEAAIAEGRDTIHDLRPGSTAHSDLAHLLRAAGEELSASPPAEGHSPIFRLMVEGPQQTLSPVLQDELYRIGREVLRNAFKHAQAKRIEVEIRHDNRMLRLRIRDDGIGIDPKMLAQGARPGHWGLPGVRERAKRVGAKLDFWSEVGAGTEVQISVPAAIAYGKSREGRVFRLFRSHAD